MRLLNYIALSLFALVGFISCEMREEIKSGKEGVDMGLLKLSVQAKSPAVTKATSVSTAYWKRNWKLLIIREVPIWKLRRISRVAQR